MHTSAPRKGEGRFAMFIYLSKGLCCRIPHGLSGVILSNMGTHVILPYEV